MKIGLRIVEVVLDVALGLGHSLKSNSLRRDCWSKFMKRLLGYSVKQDGWDTV